MKFVPFCSVFWIGMERSGHSGRNGTELTTLVHRLPQIKIYFHQWLSHLQNKNIYVWLGASFFILRLVPISLQNPRFLAIQIPNFQSPTPYIKKKIENQPKGGGVSIYIYTHYVSNRLVIRGINFVQVNIFNLLIKAYLSLIFI